ncbi:MAG TPA: pseudouridine-5'-phosphate glycosidase [Patescibacteria group bacterium]|nr:pseudouridine-5'-phosphate glycosidase [Patescibacteria group bacterium]
MPRYAAAVPDDARLAALRARLAVAPEVAAAISAGRPVVALESTLISHGLPFPQNVEVAAASEAAVRESGAVPATVAVRDGRILVGLDAGALGALSTTPGIRKVARPTLAGALAAGGWGATTVSATIIAAHGAGIRVFATGGIGGVHAGAFEPSAGPDGRRPPSVDVSVDLEELARTPVVVVCAGPKAILDVPATLEVLETRGVPVVAVGGGELPGFFSRGSGIPAPQSVPDETAAAVLAAVHLELLGSGVLICVPVPAADELPRSEATAVIAQATAEAEAAGIHGPALTPWVLRRVADLTDGRSDRANAALIVNNARVAGRLAVILARG